MIRNLFVGILVFLFVVTQAYAVDVAVVNSKNWEDVYSVSLASAFNGQRTIYVTSESLLALSKSFTQDAQLHVFESTPAPYIPSLGTQLQSAGYAVSSANKSDSFNLDLDIRSGSYILLSDSNFRSSISAAAYAVKNHAWVLFVTEANVNQVVARINGEQRVVAIGQFPRAVRTAITPYVTQTINNDNIFTDTQVLAQKYGLSDTVTLADGTNLEEEFFQTKTPVLLSGPNRILDDTYTFLQANNIKNVVIVGNQLAVVGEQIRSKSNKTISVYIKFAQSDTRNTGSLFALTFYPLPQPTLGLTITKVSYDQSRKQLVAYFQNTGNTGVYVLSTITLRQNGQEIATVSAPQTIYVASGESLPVFFDKELPSQTLSQPITAEFYTSFGATPNQLDSFLTLTNKFGPPFSIPVTVENVDIDTSVVLNFIDATYYPALNRVGVTVLDNSTKQIYYTVKLNGLLVHGLKTDLAKTDFVAAGATRKTYLSASLDDVDTQENAAFNITIVYGAKPDQEFQTIIASPAFKVGSAISTTTIVIIAIIILIVLILAIAVWRKRK